jgi:hypothetical protein
MIRMIRLRDDNWVVDEELGVPRGIEPMPRRERAAMPVRGHSAQARARTKTRFRTQLKHKHRLYDGLHHRRRLKWLPESRPHAAWPTRSRR